MNTNFTQKTEDIVKSIPKGQVMTYGKVAEQAGSPGAARAVGNIMRKNSDKSVPCHRVVCANGQIGDYNGINGSSKEKLLVAERVEMKDGKVVF